MGRNFFGICSVFFREGRSKVRSKDFSKKLLVMVVLLVVVVVFLVVLVLVVIVTIVVVSSYIDSGYSFS